MKTLNDQMKISIVVSSLNRGGAELNILKLIAGLESSFHFQVICLYPWGSLKDEFSRFEIDLVFLDFPQNPFSSIKKLYTSLKSFKPDIVHTWMYHADFLGGLMAKFLGVKRIIWSIRSSRFMGLSSSTRIIFILNSFLSYFIPSNIVCVSESSYRLHSRFGYSRKKMINIPNGYLRPVSYSKEFLRELLIFHKLKINSFKILSVGRFHKVKDHIGFVKACMSFLDLIQTYDNQVEVIIIGKGVNNSSLKNLFCGSRYEDNFHLIEEVEDPFPFYKISEIFCLHSRSEGFPNALVESIISGCFPIATDVGDARLIMEDDRFIIPPGSTQEFIEKMIEVFSLSAIDRNKIKNSIKERVLLKYSNEIVLRHYRNLYLEE